MGAYDQRRRKRFGFVSEDHDRPSSTERGDSSSADQHQRQTATNTEGEAALPAPPWSMTHRPPVWLPAGGVGGDRPRRPARAGTKSRM